MPFAFQIIAPGGEFWRAVVFNHDWTIRFESLHNKEQIDFILSRCAEEDKDKYAEVET